MKDRKLKKLLLNKLSIAPYIFIGLLLAVAVFRTSLDSSSKSSLQTCQKDTCISRSIRLTTNGCGSGKGGYVQTSINFGCYGNKCASTTTGQTGYCSSYHNGIIDLMFAVIRFLSDGVGLVVILSVIIGGIQFITSHGDPNATQSAIRRLTSALTALLIFIFAYAILNYVIPNGLLHQ